MAPGRGQDNDRSDPPGFDPLTTLPAGTKIRENRRLYSKY